MNTVKPASVVQSEQLEESPTREEAEEAVRTLIKWAGDDPNREGLRDTPARVVRSYEEFFDGYEADPKATLARTFEETDGYDEIVLLRGIRFESHCEHHMAPIIGRAHVAYLPRRRIVGISKLARLVETFADPGKINGPSRQHHRRHPGSPGCRRRHRGRPPLHDHAGHPQARHRHGYQQHARRLPRRRLDPAGISRPIREYDIPVGWLLKPNISIRKSANSFLNAV